VTPETLCRMQAMDDIKVLGKQVSILYNINVILITNVILQSCS